MEPTTERKLFILTTCKYVMDKRVVASVRPQIVSIQHMFLQDKIKVNGYSWLRDANLIWLDLPTFIEMYPENWKVLIGQYSQDWLNRIEKLNLGA